MKIDRWLNRKVNDPTISSIYENNKYTLDITGDNYSPIYMYKLYYSDDDSDVRNNTDIYGYLLDQFSRGEYTPKNEEEDELLEFLDIVIERYRPLSFFDDEIESSSESLSDLSMDNRKLDNRKLNDELDSINGNKNNSDDEWASINGNKHRSEDVWETVGNKHRSDDEWETVSSKNKSKNKGETNDNKHRSEDEWETINRNSKNDTNTESSLEDTPDNREIDIFIPPNTNRYHANYLFKKMVDFSVDNYLFYDIDDPETETQRTEILVDPSLKEAFYAFCYTNSKHA